MLYFLLFLLNFGSPQVAQENLFIGKWRVVETRDPESNEVTDTFDDMVMNIYSNGKVEVIDEGDSEIRDWKMIDGVFYLMEDDDKEKVEIKIEGDDMIWNYDEELIVFKRMK